MTLAPVRLDRGRQARQHTAAVKVHRTGAALTVVAPLLGTGQAEALAQNIQQ